MANLIRSAKSAGDWSMNELLAYNITIHQQNALEFFNRELGSIDHLDYNLLSTVDPSTTSADLSPDTYQFLGYLDLVLRANSKSDQECAINEFAQRILRVTRFEERGTILCTCYNVPFTVCGDSTKASNPGVCLLHLNSMILLVVQEDRTSQGSCEPEAQVIAEAIAAFQHNNNKRRDLGLQPLESMTIPCITIVGTQPHFYKVPVTMELNNAVVTGQYPQQPTTVTCCAPDGYQASDGMEVLDYRQIALQYYDAFRELAKGLWSTFLSH